MANNYYDATGVLILDRVTPVITALFGAFNLDGSYPGNGKAYIARLSSASDPQWSDVLDGLLSLAAALDLPAPDDEDVKFPWVLNALAKHFGTDTNIDLLDLIEHYRFDEDADLEALFLIASCFNDGHNLTAIEFEGSWRCDKPRLFEFGGNGCFLSREICVFSSSSDALRLGQDLRKALVADDLVKASTRIARVVLDLLVSVPDKTLRTRLRRSVADRLLTEGSSQSVG